MKNTITITKDGEHSGIDSDDKYYPYGTSLCIEDEDIDTLGLSNVKIGDVIELRGSVVVTAISQRADDGGEDSKSVSLQFTKITTLNDTQTARVKTLYGDGES